MNPVAVNAKDRTKSVGNSDFRESTKGKRTQVLRNGDHFGRTGEIFEPRSDESPSVETKEISFEIDNLWRMVGFAAGKRGLTI